MHQASVAIFVQRLNGLAACLKKAAAHYGEKKYDEASLLGYRLYPDMFNFTRQVQLATDHARNCTARLAGQEPPKVDDNEKNLADLAARVEKTVAFLGTIKAEQLNGSEDKSITIKVRDTDTTFTGAAFLLNRSMPNFYFHVTTAYDIMRHNGVELGKRDFMG
jgi:hypothetical protein